MARIKISKTKAFDIELIQFEKKGPVFLNVRQMYATQKDPEFKPGRAGMALPIAEGEDGRSEARRVLKAMIKVLKNEDEAKPRLLPKKEK
jgi:hypothetical protein